MKLKFKEVYENNKEKFIGVGITTLCAVGTTVLVYSGYKMGKAVMVSEINKDLEIVYTKNPELKVTMMETIKEINSQKG